ncbi:MAG TPA: GMC family oxidoreductase [Pseudolabrys sp.]|nr:GMC family oxidoreductase [Pseudolabrys sp.]
MVAPEKVDVAIVGAGMSGSIFAAVLAKAGKKVVLLEQGPDWQLGDLISSDIWGRRIKPTTAQVVLQGKNPVGYGFNFGHGTGGAALHYFANFPRLLPSDFKVKSQYGRGLDWPISYDDLSPYYDKVARDVGVSGDDKAEEIWRPKGEAYPMPPLKSFRHGQVWLKGFEQIGIRMVPAPVAINSTDYNGRPACIYDGWCHVGCPIGALANPQVTYLAEARKAGATVRPFCTTTRILTNAAGTKATGVEYYDEKREKQVQEASVVILAGAAVSNPRLLLNSATDKHPKGLSNASGLVGNYVMTHFAGATWAIFDEDVQSHMGITGAQFMSYDKHPKTSHKDAFGSTFWVAGLALKTSDLAGFANARGDLFGPELAAFMKRAKPGLTRVQGFGEEMPDIENRVELASEKDDFGMPLPKVTHSYGPDVIALWNAILEEGVAAAKAAGAKEAWPARPVIPTIHMTGGTIMGTAANNSVANSYGQSHEIANLWIGGAGLFPTEGAANPTYTLDAVALRGAEHLAANWGTIAN